MFLPAALYKHTLAHRHVKSVAKLHKCSFLFPPSPPPPPKAGTRIRIMSDAANDF